MMISFVSWRRDPSPVRTFCRPRPPGSEAELVVEHEDLLSQGQIDTIENAWPRQIGGLDTQLENYG